MVARKEASTIVFAVFVLIVIANLASFIEKESGLLSKHHNPTDPPLLSSLPDGVMCSKFMLCSSTRINRAITRVPAGEQTSLWGGAALLTQAAQARCL